MLLGTPAAVEQVRAVCAERTGTHVGAWPTFSLYRDKAYSLGPELNMAVSSVYAAEGQCYFLAPCGVISDEMVRINGRHSPQIRNYCRAAEAMP